MIAIILLYYSQQHILDQSKFDSYHQFGKTVSYK